MTANRLLKKLLRVKGAFVDSFDLEGTDGPDPVLVVHVHLGRRHLRLCPECGRRCPVHDYLGEETFWRGMDLGPVRVLVGARVPRVRCREHGVHVAAVPWAAPGSRFTRDMARVAAWLVKGGMNRTRVSEMLRVDWDTVGRLVAQVWHELEPDVRGRLDGLVEIGIDETSHKKGHRYISTVVNHRTNTVVWACDGHGKDVLDKFFGLLTPEQRAGIRVVTADGARWITDAIEQYCPNARRCLDPFHVVQWATSALDAVRLDAWRKARAEWAGRKREADEGDARAQAAVRDARRAADAIKHSKYALGKAPENLTERQLDTLAAIQAEDGPLARAHAIKEQLRLILKIPDADEAAACLDRWIARTQRCRIPAFVELQRKIRRHREHILNAIRHGVSNARIEATNNKIKLLIRIAYGFHDVNTMISLIMLVCSPIEIPWPGRELQTPVKPGAA